MPSVNPGPATTSTPSQIATLTPVNALGPTVPGQAGNAYRLLGVARAVSGNSTGDAAVMQIINSNYWAPAVMMTSNGQVSGVRGLDRIPRARHLHGGGGGRLGDQEQCGARLQLSGEFLDRGGHDHRESGFHRNAGLCERRHRAGELDARHIFVRLRPVVISGHFPPFAPDISGVVAEFRSCHHPGL